MEAGAAGVSAGGRSGAEGVGALRILSSNAVESILRRRIAATRQLTVIVKHEGDGFVAMCAELDIASQGTNVSESRGELEGGVGVVL